MTFMASSCRLLSSLNLYKNIFNPKRQHVPLVYQYAGIKSLEEKIGLPPRPKKPLTPYFRYMKEIRPSVHSKNPKASVMEVVKIIATNWETVDDKIKQKLQDEYKKDRVVYAEQRAKYDSKVTDEQRTELKQLKLDVVEAKERKAMRKRIKDLNKPKKPASAFLKFIADERTATPQTANQTYKNWLEETTKKWGRLTDAEKASYIKASRIELDKYKKEISTWEEKMIKAGNIDVVRNESLIDPPKTKPKATKTKSNE